MDQAALSYARKVRVRVNSFDIIYKLFEYLEEQIKVQLFKIGEALVLTTFDVKKLGVIAGCQVKKVNFLVMVKLLLNVVVAKLEKEKLKVYSVIKISKKKCIRVLNARFS